METLQPAPTPVEPPEAARQRWWRRRWVWAVAAAALALGIAAVVALAGDDDGTVTSSDTTRRSTTTLAEPTTTATTTAPTTTPTRAGDTTTAPSPTTTSVQTTTTGVPDAVPGTVTATARPGGGSGEIAVQWDTVVGATGYRVLRAETAGGTYGVIADIDVTTGARTSATEVTTIWSQGHSYGRGALTAPDRSPWFELIEVGGARERCFQVVAYNAAGQGPASAAACSRST